MMAHKTVVSSACTLGIAASCLAQQLLTNPAFETSQIAPWSVASTNQGATMTSGVVSVDIDGAGPAPASPALRLMVGQATAGTGAQGVTVTQAVNLVEGSRYWARFDWGAHALVNAYNQSAGVFELIVDGQARAAAQAPVLAPNQRAGGSVRALVLGTQTRAFAVGARVTRPALRGEEVFQYLDNFSVAPACIADFDESGSVGVQDLFAFLGAYFAGSADANVDFGPDLGVGDLFFFLAAYFRGCP